MRLSGLKECGVPGSDWDRVSRDGVGCDALTAEISAGSGGGGGGVTRSDFGSGGGGGGGDGGDGGGAGSIVELAGSGVLIGVGVRDMVVVVMVVEAIVRGREREERTGERGEGRREWQCGVRMERKEGGERGGERAGERAGEQLAVPVQCAYCLILMQLAIGWFCAEREREGERQCNGQWIFRRSSLFCADD